MRTIEICTNEEKNKRKCKEVDLRCEDEISTPVKS